jgi:DNA-binding ferritin-like protein
LQALFATMATELAAYADMVAERIAVLGGVARGTARTAATQSTLLEYPSDLIEGSAHVLALAERFASYSTALRTSMKHAMDVEDVGSAALYTDHHARGREAARALGSPPPPLRGTRSPAYRDGGKRVRSQFFFRIRR